MSKKTKWKPAAKSHTKDWTRIDTAFILIGLALLGAYIWLN